MRLMSRSVQSSSSLSSTSFDLPGFFAFVDGERGDDEASDGVGPRRAGKLDQPDADQREMLSSTQRGLGGVDQDEVVFAAGADLFLLLICRRPAPFTRIIEVKTGPRPRWSSSLTAGGQRFGGHAEQVVALDAGP